MGNNKRDTQEYKEGFASFYAGESCTDNPWIGVADPDAPEGWDWNFGWTDALAQMLREIGK